MTSVWKTHGIGLTLIAVWSLLSGCASPVAVVSGGQRTPSPDRSPTTAPRPTATPIPPPRSWLAGTTLLTIYGRGFGTAPILGRLGMDGSFADLARQVQPFVRGVRSANGGRRVRVAVHLIYGLATPCADAARCLSYLDDTGVNIVRQYILPAARRGWLVVLDDQLGSSTPAAEVARIRARGYLRYDNVAVAFDPEFRADPGQPVPGIPVGRVTAQEINAAGAALDRATRRIRSPHRRLLLVHQFQFGMIADRGHMRMRYPYVDPVVVADGFGTPGVKAHVYSQLVGRGSRRLRWRGIKLFYPNPYEQAGHGDSPLMTWAQVFGRAGAVDPYGQWFVRPAPNVVVVA